MQAYLSTIQTILSDWYLLTLANPLYATALAVVVWLLTAMLYSVKIASLKKEMFASEQVRTEIQNNLDSAQQQLIDMQEKMQQIQEELTVNREQMEKDKRVAENEAQRALGFEQQIFQRNKQIAGIIENLATHFYFAERPSFVAEDIKAESLWQQHDKVITQLADRLRSVQQTKLELQQAYQAETTKQLEQEALIATLQTTLATQTSQVAKLEQGLEEQKSILQQQQNKAQQALSNMLEKHQADLAHLAELEQQALELVNAKQQLTQLAEQLTAKEVLIAQLKNNKPAEQVKVEPQPEFTRQDENIAPIELNQPDEETQPVLPDIQQAPENPVNEQSAGLAGKIKNLFGMPKQQLITEEPEAADIKVDLKLEEIQLEPLAEEQQPVNPVKGQFGKIKGLFGSKREEVEDTVQEGVQTEPLVDEQLVNEVKEPFGIIKSLLSSKKQEVEVTAQQKVQPETSVEEQQRVNPYNEPYRIIKSLFGGKREGAENAVDEEALAESLVEEQQTVNSVKGQFGKIKNLFGSKKQQDENTGQEEMQPINSDKEQFDESTEKTAGISNQLKGFYRKFTAKSE